MKKTIKIFLFILISSFTVKAEEIRVGITEYQNIEQVYRRYQEFFDELEQIADQQNLDIHFRFAIGTYNEVIDWYSKKLIDVAVLSAMPIADLLTVSGTEEREKIRTAFLAKLNPVGGRIVKCEANPCRRSLDEPSAQCAPDVERSRTVRPQYHAAAIVSADSGLKSLDDVRELAGKKKLKFLFVRPVSISGYIVPSYYLKLFLGIDVQQEEFDFTYQHQESLQRIIRKDEKDKDKKVVAFVIENTSYCVSDADANKQFFTELKDDRLTTINIPQEVMLVNSNLDSVRVAGVKRVMVQILKERVNREKYATPQGFSLTMRDQLEDYDWLGEYHEAKKIYESTRGARPMAYGASFDDFINSLITYEKSTGKNPRLALVLSGGGAKCAYQAGAVSEIENKLRELKKNQKFENIDFDLIVGTSGGAINALLAALGGTNDPKTQKQIREMWTDFHQEHFFTPSPVFNFVFGLCFGLLQALVITFAVLLFGRRRLKWTRIGQLLLAVEMIEIILAAYLDVLTSAFAIFIIAQVVFVVAVAAVIRSLRRSAMRFLRTRPGEWWCRMYRDKVGDWWRIAGWLMLVVSVIEILIAQKMSLSSWPSVLESHNVTHLWLLFLLICSLAFPWSLLLGLVMVLSGIAGRFDIDWHGRRQWLVRMLTASVLMFAGILIVNSLWKESALSKSIQIERAFIRKVPEMLDLLHNGFAPASGQDEKEQLTDISRRIVNDSSMLKRDLVITVSNLPLSESQVANIGHLTANELPEDLYFYYHAKKKPGSQPPPNEKRFISFRDNPDKLLDVVIGSGTIYPLFPYRDLRKVNIGANKIVEQINVIDGGFIHNSPVEAAITWGATHIISIEASPESKPFDPRNTFENSLVAFSYIMAQTQRGDATVRGEAEIFELRPRSDCEKKNLETRCNPDPEPNMDTFDFDKKIVENAFAIGKDDAGSTLPLFKRVPGPPRFRQTKRQAQAEAQAHQNGRKEAPHAFARRVSKYPLAAATSANRD